jgi:hypothetical protein
MAEPTSILTFYDLILRTAELAGVAYYGASGDQRAIIPVDIYNFDKCKRVVNSAVRMFIANAPENGWRWKKRIMSVTFGSVETTGTVDSGNSTTLVDDALESIYDTDDDINGYYVYDITAGIYALITDYTASGGTVTVAGWLDFDGASSTSTPSASDSYAITDVQTVEGDKARYLLSEDFGSIMGKLTFAKSSSRGHLLEWRNEAEIRARREITVNTGYPLVAAVRRYRNQRRWEIILDPSPTATDTILFPYEVGFDELLMECGIGNAGDTTSITDADLANLYPDDYFNGWTIRLIDGTGAFSYAPVTDYTGSSGKFDVADWLERSGAAAGTDPGATTAYYVEPAYNKHPAGLLFDDVVLSACKAQTEMEFDDVQAGYVEKFYKVDLPLAHAADKRSAPRTLGKMGRGGLRRSGRSWINPPYSDISGTVQEA